MTLSELLATATKVELSRGDTAGVCVVCSKETKEGIRIKDTISDNFTGWSYLYQGNCMCPDCYYIFSDQTFRRKSWVVSLEDGFRIFKNDEAVDILFNPPEPPFFVYIAKIGQKQGWLTCLHRVAWNKNRYFLAHEKYDVPILFEKDIAITYFDQVKQAFGYGISKTEMLEGNFSSTTWKKAIQGGYEDFLHKISRNKKNLLWEVIVDVSRKDTESGRERAEVGRATGLLLQYD